MDNTTLPFVVEYRWQDAARTTLKFRLTAAGYGSTEIMNYSNPWGVTEDAFFKHLRTTKFDWSMMFEATAVPAGAELVWQEV